MSRRTAALLPVALVNLDREHVPALTVARSFVPGDVALKLVRELREGRELEVGEAWRGSSLLSSTVPAVAGNPNPFETPWSGSTSPPTTIPHSTVPDANKP